MEKLDKKQTTFITEQLQKIVVLPNKTELLKKMAVEMFGEGTVVMSDSHAEGKWLVCFNYFIQTTSGKMVYIREYGFDYE